MSYGVIMGQSDNALLQEHIDNKNNPHGVTAKQVNALSTGGGRCLVI